MWPAIGSVSLHCALGAVLFAWQGFYLVTQPVEGTLTAWGLLLARVFLFGVGVLVIVKAAYNRLSGDPTTLHLSPDLHARFLAAAANLPCSCPPATCDSCAHPSPPRNRTTSTPASPTDADPASTPCPSTPNPTPVHPVHPATPLSAAPPTTASLDSQSDPPDSPESGSAKSSSPGSRAQLCSSRHAQLDAELDVLLAAARASSRQASAASRGPGRALYTSRASNVVASVKVLDHDVPESQFPALQAAATAALQHRLDHHPPEPPEPSSPRQPCLVSVLCTSGCVQFIFTVAMPSGAAEAALLDGGTELQDSFLASLPPELRESGALQVSVVEAVEAPFCSLLPPAIPDGVHHQLQLQLPTPLPDGLASCDKLLAIQDNTTVVASTPLDPSNPTAPLSLPLPPLPPGSVLHLLATTHNTAALLPLASTLVLRPAAAAELNFWATPSQPILTANAQCLLSDLSILLAILLASPPPPPRITPASPAAGTPATALGTGLVAPALDKEDAATTAQRTASPAAARMADYGDLLVEEVCEFLEEEELVHTLAFVEGAAAAWRGGRRVVQAAAPAGVQQGAAEAQWGVAGPQQGGCNHEASSVGVLGGLQGFDLDAVRVSVGQIEGTGPRSEVEAAGFEKGGCSKTMAREELVVGGRRALGAPRGEGEGQAQKLLRTDGWSLLGFLLTQMLCLVMASRTGFLVPWQATMGCNILTGGALALCLAHPPAYLRWRLAFMVACRAACTFGALFAASGLIQSAALQMNHRGAFDLKPGLAGLTAMASCTLFKSTFLQDHVGRLNSFFHTFEVLGIGYAGLRTYPHLLRTPSFGLILYWTTVLLVWGALPLCISSCLSRRIARHTPPKAHPLPAVGASKSPLGSPPRRGPAPLLLPAGGRWGNGMTASKSSGFGWHRRQARGAGTCGDAVATPNASADNSSWRLKSE